MRPLITNEIRMNVIARLGQQNLSLFYYSQASTCLNVSGKNNINHFNWNLYLYFVE